MTTYRHNDMSRLIVLALVLAAGLLAGCARDVPEIKEEKAEISVTTNLTPMRMRANTIDSNSELQGYDIKIDAYYSGTDTKYIDGTKLHYTGGDPAWQFWSGSPGSQAHYYWPFEGSKVAGGSTIASTLDFVGFCPFDKPTYIGAPTYAPATGVSFSCDMSSYMTLAQQVDLDEFIVSVLNAQTLATQTAAGGALPMVFKHPLAIIKFSITAASGMHVQINSISISDLKTGGTCTFNGSTMEWSSLSGTADMTITQTLKNGGTTVSTPFAVIPNNYGSKYLTVNATWDEWSDVTISDYGTNVDFSWEPGRIYTYNLTLDKYGLKVDETKFTEQW